MESSRTAVNAIARFGLHELGLVHALAWRHRNSFQILTYHRFDEPKITNPAGSLKKQCEYIRKHFHPVSMSQVAQALQGKGTLPPKALAITVDDGYADFFSVAFPILREYEIPATVYLISDFIDGKLWNWWDKIEYATRHTAKKDVEVCLPSQTLRFLLGSHTERAAANEKLCLEATKLANRDRLALVERLPEIFDLEIPAAAPAEYAALSWADIRTMSNDGMEFGGHSRTHPVLTSLESGDAVRDEVSESKRRIEEELQCPAIHFCYPNGDYDDRVIAEVKACGYLSATTVLSGFDSPATDPFLLKRHSIDLDLPDYYFRERLAGLH